MEKRKLMHLTIKREWSRDLSVTRSKSYYEIGGLRQRSLINNSNSNKD